MLRLGDFNKKRIKLGDSSNTWKRVAINQETKEKFDLFSLDKETSQETVTRIIKNSRDLIRLIEVYNKTFEAVVKRNKVNHLRRLFVAFSNKDLRELKVLVVNQEEIELKKVRRAKQEARRLDPTFYAQIDSCIEGKRTRL